MDTETIDRLYLELSQFTQAKTARELALEKHRDELLWFAKQIFNGLDTRAIRIETEQDEILANVLHRGHAALTPPAPKVDQRTPAEVARDILSAYGDDLLPKDLRALLKADIAQALESVRT